MFDVITFGSATSDIFVEIPREYIKKEKQLISGRGFVFNIGSKIDIPGMKFAFGGGGVNTASSFIRQGFQTAYCGMIGSDIAGRELVEHLKSLNIDTSFICTTKERVTNSSVVISARGEDRVILVWRGASELLGKNDINWDRLAAKLFYLAPLSGQLSNLTGDLILHAKKIGAIVAANFGNSQLKLEKNSLKTLLAQIDYLILNLEEASLMTGINYKNEKKIIAETVRFHQGVNIITKGKDGAIVTANGMVYHAKQKEFEVIDVTGAGDAFGSGFMCGILDAPNDIEYAIKMAMVNAKHCLSSRGSDKLLSKEENYLIPSADVAIKVEKL